MSLVEYSMDTQGDTSNCNKYIDISKLLRTGPKMFDGSRAQDITEYTQHIFHLINNNGPTDSIQCSPLEPFTGQILTVLQCLNCQNRRTSSEQLQILIICIPEQNEPVRMQELFDTHFTPEILEDKIVCPDCGPQVHSKHCLLYTSPSPRD